MIEIRITSNNVNLTLNLMYSRLDGKNDDGLEFQQPNYFTRLLLAEDEVWSESELNLHSSPLVLVPIKNYLTKIRVKMKLFYLIVNYLFVIILLDRRKQVRKTRKLGLIILRAREVRQQDQVAAKN